MPRKITKQVVVEVDENARDATMARLAAARVCAQSTIESIDEALALFVEPEDDEKGKDRRELMEAAIDSTGACTRALEAAQESFEDADPEECEPWDEDSDDEEEETKD